MTRQNVGDWKEWKPTNDVKVLKERLRQTLMAQKKCRAKVLELKGKNRRLMAEARRAEKLRHEEGYQEALLALAPRMLAIDERIATTVETLMDKLATDAFTQDDLAVVKALLPEVREQRNRLYGKTRQRVQSDSTHTLVDVAELARLGHGGALSLGGPDPDTPDTPDDTFDVEFEEEE